MAIIGESLEGYVDNQIKVRQELQGKLKRSRTDISLLSNTNAWLKLASSVEITKDATEATLISGSYEDSDINAGEQKLRNIGLNNTSQFTGTQLAKKAILFNTLSEKTGVSLSGRSGVASSADLWNSRSSYGLGGNKYGIQPSPGLISAKIDCKNRGSIREATVEMKAYNLFQFELIELLYLRIGYTMLLEWGWSQFLNGNSELQKMGSTLIEDTWFEGQENNYSDTIKEIDNYRRKHSGNYDGFLGKVVNFDWKFSSGGTYDITLKLITVGDVIESLTMNNPSSIITEDSIKKLITTSQGEGSVEASTLSSYNSPIVTNAGDSIISNDLFFDIINYPDKWSTFTTRQVGRYNSKSKNNYFGFYTLLQKEDNYKPIDKNNIDDVKEKYLPPQGTDFSVYNYFLTFSQLLSKMEDLCIPSMNGSKMLKIDQSDTSICSIYPNQVSLDPRVCLIKPTFSSFQSSTTSTAEESTQDTRSAQLIINEYKSLNLLKDFTHKEGDFVCGQTMNIYLNYDFVSKCLKKNSKDNNITIFKFLQDICSGINEALGNVQSLEPVILNDEIITIIDQNPIPGIKSLPNKFSNLFNQNPTSFEIFGYNPSGSIDPETKELKSTSNFVKDFGFTTKLSPELASMITIGATAENLSTKNYDGTAFSKWNEGLKDRYNLEIQTSDNDDTSGKGDDSKPEYFPLTFEDLGKLKKHFDDPTQSPIDTRNFLGFKRDQVKIGIYGFEGEGIRDVSNSPISSKSYENVNFKEYVLAVKQYKQIELSKKKKQENKNKNEKTIEKVENYLSWLSSAFGAIITNNGNKQEIKGTYYFNLNQDFIKLGKRLFKGYINDINNQIYKDKKIPSNTTGFIPINLSIDIEGLSGIKIYNSLNIQQGFLPRNYPTALSFIIKNVNHDISSNNWSTSIQTISTANVKETEFTWANLSEYTSQQLEIQLEQLVNGAWRQFVNDTPWSAAFISYVVKNTNFYSNFPVSAAHTGYAQTIRENPDEYGFIVLDPRKQPALIGDIIIANRSGNNLTFDDGVWTGSSHGNIVTSRNYSTITSAGGNVYGNNYPEVIGKNGSAAYKKREDMDDNGDSVNRKYVLDRGGNKYFAILRPKKAAGAIVNTLEAELRKWGNGKIDEQDEEIWETLREYYTTAGLTPPQINS